MGLENSDGDGLRSRQGCSVHDATCRRGPASWKTKAYLDLGGVLSEHVCTAEGFSHGGGVGFCDGLRLAGARAVRVVVAEPAPALDMAEAGGAEEEVDLPRVVVGSERWGC